jgi:hypothetical protein
MLHDFYTKDKEIKSARIVKTEKEMKEEEEDRKQERKLINERMHVYYESIKDSVLS